MNRKANRDRSERNLPRWRRWTGWLVPQQNLGERGERVAERFLKRHGLKIIGRRDRGRWGELDLVATDGQVVIFVEVKTRTSHIGGEPYDAVNAEKQRRLTRAALGFLKRHGLTEYPARFDIVSVTWQDSARRPKIEHIAGAFDAVGVGQMFS
ncbi:MAG: YraN family protein [Pirellulales bacterium]|nr:YraN family protein [Pirellulales bacterium]